MIDYKNIKNNHLAKDYYINQSLNKPNFKTQDTILLIVLVIAVILAIYWTI